MVFQEKMANGIRILGDTMEKIRSCAIGVWIGTGSAFEEEGEGGASHFIEHMLFKGTKTRSAQDIAVEMDSIGGSINAFTSKECTCYYAKVLDEHVGQAVDILADIVQNSKLDPEDIKKEQGVICEEILMIQDSPEDLAHESIAGLYYEGDPLSKPILGTEQTVRSFNQESLHAYMKRQYVPERIVISVAGHFEKQYLIDLFNEKFQSVPHGQALEFKQNKAPGGRRFLPVERDIEQIHICMAMPGAPLDSLEQYALFILSNVLGGSMSSRLFQKIREERGLAYSIYSYPTCYRSTGSFSFYAGTGENQAVEVLKIMRSEVESVLKDGITQEEFKRSKEQLKGSYLLAQEGTSSHMNALGKTALLLNRVYNEQETIQRIESITQEDVERLIPTVLDINNTSTVCVGRVKKQEAEVRSLLEIK